MVCLFETHKRRFSIRNKDLERDRKRHREREIEAVCDRI